MKVIDMLDIIAKGEEVRFKIIETDEILNLKKDMHLFSITYNEPIEWFIDEEWLNYEVEIVEEDKKIERLGTWFSLEKDCENDNIQYANHNFREFYNKINEIIDKVNKGE